MRTAFLVLVAGLMTSACAASYRAQAAPDTIESAPEAVAEAAIAPPRAPRRQAPPAEYRASSSAKKSAEEPAPMRRPDAAYARRQAFETPPRSSGAVVEIPAKRDGMKILEVFALLERETGKSILYDDRNAAVKNKRVHLVGDRRIYRSDLLAWAQAVLYQQGLALSAVGPLGADGERQWVAVDQASPMLDATTVVAEDDLPRYATRDGLLISSMFSLPVGIDPSRVRTALSMISTKTAGIGRINDIKDARAVMVQDFAPKVARMRQMLDEMEIALWEAQQR